MPIKPENRTRYPADWQQIRERVLERARWRCEHPGCRARHRQLGYWREGEWVTLPRSLREAGVNAPTTIDYPGGGQLKIIMIVLTIAHLDHTPEHCEPENLRAWCQRHHLAYDARHHAQTAYETRRAGKVIRDLFSPA